MEQIEDEETLSPHAYVRAIVELEDRFRRANQSQVADDPVMRCVSTHFVDPRPTWAGNLWLQNYVGAEKVNS